MCIDTNTSPEESICFYGHGCIHGSSHLSVPFVHNPSDLIFPFLHSDLQNIVNHGGPNETKDACKRSRETEQLRLGKKLAYPYVSEQTIFAATGFYHKTKKPKYEIIMDESLCLQDPLSSVNVDFSSLCSAILTGTETDAVKNTAQSNFLTLNDVFQPTSNEHGVDVALNKGSRSCCFEDVHSLKPLQNLSPLSLPLNCNDFVFDCHSPLWELNHENIESFASLEESPLCIRDFWSCYQNEDEYSLPCGDQSQQSILSSNPKLSDLSVKNEIHYFKASVSSPADKFLSYTKFLESLDDLPRISHESIENFSLPLNLGDIIQQGHGHVDLKREDSCKEEERSMLKETGEGYAACSVDKLKSGLNSQNDTLNEVFLDSDATLMNILDEEKLLGNELDLESELWEANTYSPFVRVNSAESSTTIEVLKQVSASSSPLSIDDFLMSSSFKDSEKEDDCESSCSNEFDSCKEKGLDWMDLLLPDPVDDQLDPDCQLEIEAGKKEEEEGYSHGYASKEHWNSCGTMQVESLNYDFFHV